MMSLRLSAPTLKVVQIAHGLLGWWLQELEGMLPRRLSRLLGAKADASVRLQFGLTQSVLVLPARRNGVASTVIVPHGDGRHGTARPAALASCKPGTPVTVSLDKTLLLETELDLPAAAERSLRSVVGHQIGKLVPLEPAQVCFDARIVGRSADARRIRVLLVAAKRTSIERAISLAGSLQMSPRSVLGNDVRAGHAAAAVLWRAELGRSKVQRNWYLRRCLEAASVVLFLAAYAFHVHALSTRAAELRAEVETAKRAAASTQALAARVASLRESASFLQERRLVPSPLRVLDELTRLIPDDGWVNQLALHGRKVELAGYAMQATGILSRVETSPIISAPRFRSPITASPDGQGERFDLVFDLRIAP